MKLLLFLALASSLLAQESDAGRHAPDADAMEMIPSITITAVPNASFSSVVTTEWTKTLADGSTMTRENHRVVVRDSAGRIFQERRTFVPKGAQAEPQVRWTEISDPLAHTKYFCRADSHVCTLRAYYSPATEAAEMLSADGQGKVILSRQDLGKSDVSGMEVVSTRETRTIEAGIVGNDRPISITKEFWYSPKLALNMLVKRNDPRSGAQTFTVTDLSLGEPDPKYFQVPAGFTVVDQRSATTASQ